MTFPQACILFFAAVLGGALNSVAGGGSFIGFPSLIFTGVPPINANATNTVALWPGSVASMGAYRKELASQNRLLLLVLGITSLIGGVLGALLLLHTSQTTFVRLIPYLLLVATLLFTFSPPITARLRAHKRNIDVEVASPDARPPVLPADADPPAPADSRLSNAAGEIPSKNPVPVATSKSNAPSKLRLLGISLLQLVIATYGGYFGGGIGILMLATLGLIGMENIHEMNGLKTFLTSLINGVAVITFIIAGAVVWAQAIVMVIGAIAGGYGGAYYARQLNPRLVRGFVILVGFGMTIYFFLR